MSGKSSGGNAQSGGGIPHLTLDLKRRFPTNDTEPERTENFFVHRVRDTGGHPYIIYQSLPRLSRQQALIDTIKKNRHFANSARDAQIHEKLEIIEPGVPGEPFYLIETVDGDPLGELIESQNLEQLRGMEVIENVLKALEPIHHAGLVYGSMDLDQIRVVRSEKGDYVRLGGLYRVFQPGSPVHLGFNPEFNAPSAPDGEPDWTPQDDIYVVGMIAYRLLLGRGPYREALRTPLEASAENRAGAWENQHKSSHAFALPRDLLPSISPHFEEWVIKARHSDREKRFNNAHEAVEALNKAVENFRQDRGGGWKLPESIAIIPPKSTTIVRRPLFAAFAAVMLACSLFGGFMIWNSRPDAAAIGMLNAEKLATQEVIDQNLPLASNLSEGHPLRVALEKASSLFDSLRVKKPSRWNIDDLQKGVTDARVQAQTAGDQVETLVAQATADQAAFIAQLSRLDGLLPADDAGHVKDRELGTSLAADLAAGAYDKVAAAVGGKVAALTAKADGLAAQQKQAQSSRSAWQRALADLDAQGVGQLADVNPLKAGFTQLQSAAANAETQFDARQWADSATAFAAAADGAGRIAAALSELAADTTAALEKTGTSLVALVGLALPADASIAGLTGKLNEAKDAAGRKAYDAALAILVPLEAQISEKSTALSAARDKAAADLKSGQDLAAQLAQLAPEGDAVVADAAQRLAAASETLGQRDYERASELAANAAARLQARLGELGKSRDEAAAELESYRKIQGDERVALIEGMSDGNPLRSRLAEAEAMAAEADKAMAERRWSDATAALRNARRAVEGLVAEVDAMRSSLARQIEMSRQRLAEIGRLGGDRGAELEELRQNIAAAETALAKNELESASSAITAALADADKLLETLPADRQALEAARAGLAEARGAIVDRIARLADGHALRQEFANLETRMADAEKGADANSFKDNASVFASLAGGYRKVGSDFDALASSAKQAIDTMHGSIDELAKLLPDADPAIARFNQVLDEATARLNNNAVDAAAAIAGKASPELTAVIYEARKQDDASRAERARIAEIVAKVSSELGDWTVGVPAFADIGNGLKQIDEALAARRHDLVAAAVPGATAAIDKWKAALDAEFQRAQAAQAEAAASRDAATAAGGERTAAGKAGAGQFNAGAQAFAAKQYLAASAAFSQAVQSFGGAIVELKGNQDQVAALRVKLAAHLEEAKTLLADNHLLMAELTRVAGLAAAPKEDGDPARLADFKAVDESAGPALAEAQRQRAEVLESAQLLSSRFGEVETKGGKASPLFAAIAADLEALKDLMNARDWPASLAAAKSLDGALTGLETAVRDGNLISCPENEGDRAMRQIPAGEFTISPNTLAGRLARDALQRREGSNGTVTVSVTLPFCIATAQVTVGDFEEFLADSKFDTVDRDAVITASGIKMTPGESVAIVSKADAEAYAAWLSKKTGENYQLPTAQYMLAAAAFGAKSDLNTLTRGIGDTSREWTVDACRDGANAIVLGQIGGLENRVYAQCLPVEERSPKLGFRVILMPKI